MSLQNVFDLAKKEFDRGNIECGYKANNGRLYTAYYTNDEWQTFKNEMEKNYKSAYDDFKDGDGGELDERGQYPPKMASYGSSSRFIFECSRDIPNFQFEKKLGICVPARNKKQEAKASLDGYIMEKNIYVEAKCREIYNRNTPEFNSKYEEFYTYLRDHTQGRFNFDIVKHINKKGEISRRVRFFWDNERIVHFDCKQLLCHLLGIAKNTITTYQTISATLLYLVYKPSEELLGNIKSKRTVNSIRKCWEKEFYEATTINIELIYNCVVHFLHEHKGIGLNLNAIEIERIAQSFKFHFCSQDDYLSHIQQ